MSWLVDKIEDRVGNTQTFNYNTSFGNGENLLESVTYTGYGNSPGNRKVQFTYQARGTQDISSSLLAGGVTMQTQSLAAIRTSIDGVTVRKYTPSYAPSKYSQRLLMTSLKECAGESSPCHPPTSFTYNDDYLDPRLASVPVYQLKSLEGLGLPSPSLGDNNEDYRLRVAGDYDGDGTRETVVSATTGGVTHVYLTQFMADRKAHSPRELSGAYASLVSPQISEADMDGSGRSALIGLQLDASNVAFALWNYNLFPRGSPANSNPFGTVKTNIPLPQLNGVSALGQRKTVLAADVDGNGKTDIITIRPDQSCGRDLMGYKDGVSLYKNNISSQFVIDGQRVDFSPEVKLFCLQRTAYRRYFVEETIDHIGDFNGDGLADFYLTSASEDLSKAGGIAGIRITKPGATTTEMKTCAQIGLVSNGTSTDDCSGNQNYAIRWMDVNADGLEDFVIARPTERTWRLRLNRGNGTFDNEINTNSDKGLNVDKTGSTSGPDSRFRYANSLPNMDVDGDGKTDLLIPSQRPGAQAFAVKMCTIKRVRKIVGADVPVCPSALGTLNPGATSSDALETGEICAAYSCPSNPDGSAPLPSNFSIHGENEGYPYQWNDLPAFDAYSAHANHGGPGEDNSAYHLAQLKFVQTGAASFNVSVIETPLVSKLSDYFGRSDDLFGDGLPDLITSLGCSNVRITQEGSGTDAAWDHQKCAAVTSAGRITYGPATLPDNVTSTTSLATKVALFANINQGMAAPGGSTAGVGFTAYQRPPVPDLDDTTGGMSLNLPIPNLPGLMDGAINGVGDFATWGYFPLSVRATLGGVPFYTVRTGGVANGYADDRHYYFQSSMPVVHGMAQDNGRGDGAGFRSANYGYTEAMYHHLGRGFQGFRTITASTAGPAGRQLRTATTFHQKFPLTGRVEKVETRAAGTLIKSESDFWICDISRGQCPNNGSGGGIFTPLLDKQRINTFNLTNGAAASHIETVNAATPSGGASGWDSNGNLLTQVVTSADDGAGGIFVSEHKVTTTNTYIPADNVPVTVGSWWLDRLSTSRVVTSISYDTGHPLPVGVSLLPKTVETSYLWNSPERTPQSQTVTASGKSLTTDYNYGSTTARGLPSSVTISGTGISPSRTTQFTYTRDGINPATQSDGYFVLNTTNAALQTSSTQHSPRDGQVTVQADPNGLSSTSAYDGFGRLIGMSFRDARNAVLLPPVSIGYSPCAGGACGSGYGEGDNQAYSAWRVTRVQEGSPTAVDWFDVLGRTIKHVERGFGKYDANGALIGDVDFVETISDYDAMGTVAIQSSPFYQGGSQSVGLTVWNYDALNRPTVKIAPGSELDSTNGDVKTTYAYNGSTTTIKVRANSVSSASNCPSNTNASNSNLCMDMSRSYDVLGRLEQTVQGLASDISYASTNYWYDGLGNPIAAKDAGGSVDQNGSIIKATYNDLGQRTLLDDPDAGQWQFTYNALGEVIDQTDARGVVTSHVYDTLGRLTQRTATNTASSDANLKLILDTWDYDPPGAAGLLSATARKRGANASGLTPVWQESNVYDPDTKRLTLQSNTLQGQANPWNTVYTYNSAGRPFTIGYPSGLIVKKGYTSYGDLRELSNYGTGQVYWTGSAKDAWGNLTGESWAGGITGAHLTFATTGQLKRKKWTQGLSQLNQLDYGYDSFGNLKTQSSVLSGVTASESYDYDGLQRLTKTTRTGVPGNPAAVVYRYEKNGNLSAKSDYSFGTQGAYTYGNSNCGPHAVSGVARAGTPLTYSCDANGNVTGGTALSATYDFNNQPWSINRLNDGSGSAQFAYSANGDVINTVAGAKSTWFGAVGYEESVIGGTLTQRHELGPVTVVRQSGVDSIKAVLRDRLGSQVMSVDVAGAAATVPTLSTSQNPSLSGNYTISWTAIVGATRYELVESMNGAAEVQVQNSAARTWSPPTAKPVGRYTYRVRACTPSCGAWSAPLTELRPPNPPSTVSATAPTTNGSFTVSWGFASGAESYTLEEALPNDPTFQPIASGITARNWPLSRAAGTYQYRVRACLGVSEPVCGNPSAAITVTVIDGDPQIPGAPTMNAPGPGSTTGQISLSWSPAPAPSPQPDYYVLHERFNNGGWSHSRVDDTQTQFSRGDGTYDYTVNACRNNPGHPGQPFCGANSNPVTVTVTGSGLPTAPASITSTQLACATAQSDTYTIRWAAGAGATYYDLRETNGMATPEEQIYPVTGTEKQITQTWPLPPRGEDTTFSYDVRACNAIGCSFYTGTATACFDRGHNRPESVAPTSTAYDAFGKVRNGDYSDRVGGLLNLLPDTLRGFTGHQHVDDVRLIHMNGRVYDYELGRFLSVDPVIQFPTNTQSMNPYSYIMNNPLSGRDPTGYTACSDVSVDQTNASGSCDITEGGKTSSISYSFNKNGDVGISKSASGASAGASIGVLKSNGADALGSKGASSSPLSGIASDIGQMSATVGQQASALATGAARGMFPETAALSDQGAHRSWGRSDATGVPFGVFNTGARAANEAMSLVAFLFNNIHNKDFVDYQAYDPFPVFSITPDMQRGAAIGEMLVAGASIFAAPERMGALAPTARESASAYSVAFETTIAKLGVGTRGSHFADANRSLAAAMKQDSGFAGLMDGLSIKIPQRLDRSPEGWSWHHVPDQPGAMQLVPRSQHQGSLWQRLLHPDQKGGFARWGAEY